MVSLLLSIVFLGQTQIETVNAGRWADPAVWSSGQVPTDEAIVKITKDLDCTDLITAKLKSLKVAAGGKLRVRGAGTITTGDLIVEAGGAVEIGTPSEPITRRQNVVIRDLPLDTTTDPEQLGRGIIVYGKFTCVGEPRTAFVRFGQELISGQTTLAIQQVPVGWRPGDLVYIPDTRQQILNRPYTSQGEYRTIKELSSDGKTITLVEPLAFPHRGGRDQTGAILRYPHVLNLTRNIVFSSENPDGVRGHAFFTERADVLLRYCEFYGLGRTTGAKLDNTIRDASGRVIKVGTNQLGRYAVHFHHLAGPQRTSPDSELGEGTQLEVYTSDTVIVTIDTANPLPSSLALDSDTIPNCVAKGQAEPNHLVQLTAGNVRYTPVLTNDAGLWRQELHLPEGKHQLVATVIDQAGNQSGPSQIIEVSNDWTAPTQPAIVSPPAGAQLSGPELDISGIAEPKSTITVLNRQTVIGSATANDAGDWSLKRTANPGTILLSAIAADAAGNKSERSATQLVIIGKDSNRPVITSPLEGPRNATSFEVSGTAQPGSKVVVLDGEQLLAVTTADVAGRWKASLSGLAEGPHALVAKASIVPPPSGPSDYQYEITGAVIRNPTPASRWGITIHHSHYGLVKNNVILNVAGAGMMFEDGNESFNRVIGNYVCGVTGFSRPDARQNEFGFEGSAYWARGGNNYLGGDTPEEGNFANEAQDGFVFYARFTRPQLRPAVPGGPEIITIDPVKTPILGFRYNECAGRIQNGFSSWWIGVHDRTPIYDIGKSEIADFTAWHTTSGVSGYESGNFTFIRALILGDPGQWNEFNGGIGFSDYIQYRTVIRDSKIANMSRGITVAAVGEALGVSGTNPGLFTVENCELHCLTNLQRPWTWFNASGKNLSPVTVRLVNLKLGGVGSPSEQIKIRNGFSAGGFANYLQWQPMFWHETTDKQEQLFSYDQLGTAKVPVTSEGGRIVGAPEANLTNTMAWDRYGIAVGGEVTPDTAKTRPNWRAYVGTATAPMVVFRPQRDKVIDSNSDLEIAISAYNPSLVPLTFGIEEGPAGASINPTTGVLKWRAPASGEYSFTIRAVEGGQTVQVQQFFVVVRMPPG